jgi:hypothetical protein
VQAGQAVLELRADDEDRFGPALAALDGMIIIGPEPPPEAPLILERITAGAAL